MNCRGAWKNLYFKFFLYAVDKNICFVCGIKGRIRKVKIKISAPNYFFRNSIFQKLTEQTRRVGDIMANINKDALVDAIAIKTDLSKKAVEGVIEALEEKITDEIRQGNKVTLTGFGTFKVSKRAAREGINPQTKAKIQIPAMTVPKFTAGKSLKEAVK